MRRFSWLAVFFVCLSAARAQHVVRAESPEPSLPNAQITEKQVYTFDVARPVVLFDAVADGSLWFAVDVFGVNKTITINGVHNETNYGDISPLSTQISPNGKYLIWMGMTHSYDPQSFNTTTTSVFRHDAGKNVSDSLLGVEADHDLVYFTPSGDHWAALLPSSNVKQPEPRDVAVLDGKIVSSGYPNPKMFTFGSDGASWAYRSRDGRDENLITADGKHLLYQRASADPYVIKREPIVMRFSPDVRLYDYALDGRDFDFNLPNVATLYQTSYISSKRDSVLMYIVYKGKRQLYSRWIKDVQIGPRGNHIVYFASDTAAGSASEHAVVVKDGSIVAGPYDGAWRLFLSPSGEHSAWTVNEGRTINLYVDNKKIGRVGEYMNMKWSADERSFAYATTDSHEHVYIVAGGKRSPAYDRIGRLEISPDAKTVRYMAIKYDKLVHVRQRF